LTIEGGAESRASAGLQPASRTSPGNDETRER
jgi:hypothetical protein